MFKSFQQDKDTEWARVLHIFQQLFQKFTLFLRKSIEIYQFVNYQLV
jgi:hypothetical protein